MDGDISVDGQIGEALLNKVVTDQVKAYGAEVPLNLPDTPLTDENSKKLIKELGNSIQVIGDQLDRNQEFNNLIQQFPRSITGNQFSELVQNVFNDGSITWGRIIVLFYAVGKLAVKMIQANMPALVLEIVNSCLDFFRAKLLAWIGKMGGWISSISALTQLSLERFSNSSLRNFPLSAELVVVFISGVLLGGVLFWQLNKRT